MYFVGVVIYTLRIKNCSRLQAIWDEQKNRSSAERGLGQFVRANG